MYITVQYLRHSIRPEPGADRLVVDALPHEGDLVDGVLGRLDVSEPANVSGMSGTLSLPGTCP